MLTVHEFLQKKGIKPTEPVFFEKAVQHIALAQIMEQYTTEKLKELNTNNQLKK